MGRFSYVTSSWLETASEDELRETARNIQDLNIQIVLKAQMPRRRQMLQQVFRN